MKISMVPVEDVHPYYNNIKPHVQKITKLESSIKRFGFDQPIVVDEDGIILKGHGRLIAAKNLELDEVPVTVHEGLSDVEKHEIRISDHYVFEEALIDEFAVATELESLSASDIEGIDSFFDVTTLDVDLDSLSVATPVQADDTEVADTPTPAASLFDKEDEEKESIELVICPVCNHSQQGRGK